VATDLNSELIELSEWYDLWQRGDVAMTPAGYAEFGRRLTNCAETVLHMASLPLIEGRDVEAVDPWPQVDVAPQGNVVPFPQWAQRWPRLAADPDGAQALSGLHATLCDHARGGEIGPAMRPAMRPAMGPAMGPDGGAA
jgi:hypothetical protein